MGAWGYGILESDDALDMEATLLKKLGVRYDNIPRKELLKGNLLTALEDNERLNKAWEYILGLHVSYDENDKGMAYQVLANMILTSGAKIDREDFDMIIERTKLGLYNDYYKDNKTPNDSWTVGRVKAIQNLVDLASQYDLNGGKPIDVPYEGLLEKASKLCKK